MNEKRVKYAFSVVKKDMEFLKNKISSIEKKLSKVSDLQYDDSKIFEHLQDLKKYTEEQNKRIESLFMEEGSEVGEVVGEVYSTRINDLEEKVSKIAQTKGVPEIALQEITELLSEKIQLEVNSVKMEFTQEMAKLYDSCFNEIVELKGEVNKKSKTTKPKKAIEKKIPKKEALYDSPKKDSKLKKMSKWLFVDEEENDLAEIKKQVKK